MATYTRLHKKDMVEITDYYGLTLTDFKSMEGGAGNSSYRLSTPQQQYVVTVFDDKSFAEVEALVHVLGHLADHGFETTRLHTPPQQTSAVMLFMDKPVLIKEFIVGEVIEALDDDRLEKAGTVMGQLHQVPVPTGLLAQHAYGKETLAARVQTDVDPDYEAWLTDRVARLNQDLPSTLPTSLIHGDLFYDNILFKEDGQAVIIDFEEACQYSRIFDVGMGILGMCTVQGEIRLDKAAAFVRGYQTVQPLNADEQAHLQNMVAYAATATSYWRYWKYNIHDPMPEKAQYHWHMAQLANQIDAVAHDVFSTAVF